jgi:hypothetical protein
MFRVFGNDAGLCDGLSRRELMRIGALGLGGCGLSSLTLPQLLQQRALGGTKSLAPRAKSVIVLFHLGGLPQHESWDPKPEAAEEIRGAFGAIETKTPGMRVGELMPQLARLTDKIAVVRTMQTRDNSHSSSGYQMLTGVPHIPLGVENASPGRPNDAPPLNAIVKALREPRGGLPPSIIFPRRLANFEGLYPWPGTDAGVMGPKHDPWMMVCDPSEKNFTPPGCALPDDLSTLRMNGRLSLLDQITRQRGQIERTPDVANYDRYKQQTIDLISGTGARVAFDLDREPESMRDRYGRTKFGQSTLLARRLVEAGVSLVQVNYMSENLKLPNRGGWDTHEKHNESLKGWLMPSMDQTCSALITDLDERGLLDETLVCMVAEFGHTPKFNARLGRDHWGKAFSIALAGGGIRGGVVHGRTDRHAADPEADIVTPADYLATVLHCLGFEPETMVKDMQGRPIPISRGRVVQSLLA